MGRTVMFRTVNCDMWRKDEWFAELAPDAKLIWLYVFSNDNTSPAGIYRIALRTIANETGVSLERVKTIIEECNAAGKLQYEDGIIWPVNMRKHQTGPLKSTDNLLKKVNKDIADLGNYPIVARYKAHYYLAEDGTECQARPLEGPLEALPRGSATLDTRHLTLDTGDKRQETGDGTQEPSAPPFPSLPNRGANTGRRLSGKLTKLNQKLGPELRTPLADVVLTILGTSDLANTNTDAGDAALYAAHDAVVTLWGMDYRTEQQLLDLEAHWYANDFRGQKNQNPTPKWLIEHASTMLGGPRSGRNNGRDETQIGLRGDGRISPLTAEEHAEWREWFALHPDPGTRRPDLPDVPGDALPASAP